ANKGKVLAWIRDGLGIDWIINKDLRIGTIIIRDFTITILGGMYHGCIFKNRRPIRS
ncbi:aureocin A53 family class IId bacteriocin, partial [Bacillus sp. TH17]|uniref:aureocin A53 family class IId bacteriocin n=1 Tax=Bacillus sp. TH17 TaxID=2796383 RepID=UPI001912D190|nr:aureocin A53 family class IId bacteriocin [Bacillus sp. TH17]